MSLSVTGSRLGTTLSFRILQLLLRAVMTARSGNKVQDSVRKPEHSCEKTPWRHFYLLPVTKHYINEAVNTAATIGLNEIPKHAIVRIRILGKLMQKYGSCGALRGDWILAARLGTASTRIYIPIANFQSATLAPYEEHSFQHSLSSNNGHC